ncbi:MAG TPA: hypothetical protein VJR89_30600 [Polyangiales bacterium]|nr:hypothetical protein [Polyangiales bacterium]
MSPRLAGLSSVLAAALVLPWLRAEAQAAPPAAALACVAVRGEAHYAGFGYDHRVYLTNNCKKPVTCSVTTNVNPEPATVDVAPGETQMVIMWRGSPAYEFKPDASCRER